MVGIRAAVPTFAFLLLTLSFANAGQWRGIYQDGPIAVHITSDKKVYHVGDTFQLSITATNTSDRDVLIKRDWKEQLVFYHLPGPSPLALDPSPVEWPGRVLIATWVDSTDVVRLKPGKSYSLQRDVRVWTPDDVATFPFRAKLVGVKDFGHKFDTWRGIAWSNAITLTVKPGH